MADIQPWPASGGAMGELIRTRDWSRTPLGPIDGWPQRLQTAVDIVLGASVRTAVFWGADLIVLYNDAWMELIGEKHPGALGRPAREVLAEIWETVGPMLVRVMSGRGAADAHAQPLPLDGRGRTEDAWFEYSFNPIPRGDGSIGGVLNIAAETTSRVRARARSRAEEALRRSEERYRTLFESIDEGFCIIEVLFDASGEPVDYRFLEANPAFEEQTGLHDAVGKRMRELEPRHEEHWFHTYGRIARTGEPERFTNEAKHLEDRWFDVYAFRIGRPEERKVAILFNDISERKRAEDALRDAKEEAEHASEAKSRFLSTMSHELRTPLTAVIGLSELMETEVVGSMNAKQKKHLSRIKASAQHLVLIIDEILTFSRSEAGREEVRLARVNAVGIARGVVALLAPKAEARGLALRLSGADGRVIMLTDRGKLRRILTNLVGNAVKYTEEGAVDVELHAGAESVEFRVRDTGPGIPHDRLEDIFEPFQQVDRSTTREKGGTGLGLAVSRRLARLLGGDVTVVSEVGKGSAFTVWLPRRAEDGE